jgi:hypothetical protein
MKTFKQMFDEEMMTTGDVGIPQDTKDMGPKKKRKSKILTRNYIEVNGKRKKLFK